MKILHVIAYYYPHEGGAERYCKLISQHHVKKGHKVTILTSDIAPKTEKIKRHEITPEGIEVYRMKSWMFPSRMPCIYDLDKKIREFSDYDIVHAHTPYPSIAWHVTEALEDMDIPLVTTHHCDYTRDREFGDKYNEFARVSSKVFVRDLFKRSTRIIVSTRTYADTSEELRGFRKKVKIIPMCSNIIDRTEKFEKGNYILFVGRLIWYKGVDHLVNAFSLVHEKHPEVRLRIVGRGPFEEHLRKISKKRLLKYEDFVMKFLDDEELRDTYRKALVFVLPAYTRRESFGIVLIEALSYGTPVVTFNIPGVNELVTKSKGGLTAKVGDPFDLADKINRMIEDKKFNKECAMKGKHYVQRNLTPGVVSDKTERLYKNVIEKYKKNKKRKKKKA